ncbi:Nicotinate dehydrogenase small FeS subunit [Blautia producta]|uniref:Nicotinate dehydrogenase small FeS subunit n=1 Tax=Blautia producta TaxID=33035 RepID=A0A4P6LXD4_9FIRM|nr:(2Fe-2S)-binding protein [Blautia producta]QBE96796.1 Nicotinate dehydrogenase small FeS subunit [Blautia producta]
MILHFILNGEEKTMEVPGEKRLLDFIREDLHLTGTKEGCGEGECGACTVILNGQAIHSCLTVAGQLEGSELLTIEGLEKNGEMDAIQKAFIKKSAIQCGFCTSGMVMSAKALLLHNPTPTQEEIKRAIAGNICRCSGYREIKDAIQEAAESGMGGAT